jgi:hypothetical protein
MTERDLEDELEQRSDDFLEFFDRMPDYKKMALMESGYDEVFFAIMKDFKIEGEHAHDVISTEAQCWSVGMNSERIFIKNLMRYLAIPREEADRIASTIRRRIIILIGNADKCK